MPMYEEHGADLRRAKILEMINKTGKVRVSDLSDMFTASDVTIRNDLNELEKSGVLERVHGGAVLTARKYYNMNYFERQNKNSAEKKAIAVAVAERIEEGQSVMMNSGTTTYFIACELKSKKNLRVVTNSIPISLELGQMPNIDVVLLGGSVNSQYSFSYGDDAISQLKKYKADKLILTVDGITADCGITTYHSQETKVNQVMIERAKNTIVVADFTKVGRESFSSIAPADVVDILITNKNSARDELDAIERCGAEIITV